VGHHLQKKGSEKKKIDKPGTAGQWLSLENPEKELRGDESIRGGMTGRKQ